MRYGTVTVLRVASRTRRDRVGRAKCRARSPSTTATARQQRGTHVRFSSDWKKKINYGFDFSKLTLPYVTLRLRIRYVTPKNVKYLIGKTYRDGRLYSFREKWRPRTYLLRYYDTLFFNILKNGRSETKKEDEKRKSTRSLRARLLFTLRKKKKKKKKSAAHGRFKIIIFELLGGKKLAPQNLEICKNWRVGTVTVLITVIINRIYVYYYFYE